MPDLPPLDDEPRDIVHEAERIAAQVAAPLRLWITAAVAFRWGARRNPIFTAPVLVRWAARSEAEARQKMTALCRESHYPEAEGWDLYISCWPWTAAELRALADELDAHAG